jgi:uncharacterized sulfatase
MKCPFILPISFLIYFFADFSQIGKVLHALDSKQQQLGEGGVTALSASANTVVLVHSDHGLDLGDHGHWLKRSLHESTLRTPLMLRVPPSVSWRSTGVVTSATLDTLL